MNFPSVRLCTSAVVLAADSEMSPSASGFELYDPTGQPSLSTERSTSLSIGMIGKYHIVSDHSVSRKDPVFALKSHIAR